MPSPNLTGLYSRVPRPVRHEIPRPALLDKLQSSDVPLVVLQAPGGYGKTTLLGQLARSLPGQAVWLSCREEDADPLLFCDRLVQGTRHLLPTLPLVKFEKARGENRSPPGLAAALASDLAYSTTNLAFILDGADQLGEASAKWLGRWLDDVPEGHRVLLSARAAPPFELARRVAAGQAVLIGIDELSFTPEESAACLREAPAGLDRAAVHARLEGWPIGVNLAASDGEVALFGREVLQEAFQHLPEALRGVLAELSVLETWSESEAFELGLHLPENWLEQVNLAGLPLTPFAQAVRPHSLLRELLDDRLRWNQDRYVELHRRAAERAEASGLNWQALEHYRLARLDHASLRVAHHLASEYRRRWEPRLVLQVLAKLSPALLTEELQIILAQAHIDSGDISGGETALRRLQSSGVQHAGVYFGLGTVAARNAEDARLLQLAEEGLSCSPTPRETCQLLRLKATALVHLGQVAEAQGVAQDALQLAREHHERVEMGALLDVVQYIHKIKRQWPECEAALRAALEIHTEQGMPARALLTQNNLADLLMRQGRYEEGLTILRAALPVAERERSVVTGLLVEGVGDIQARLGEYPLAREAFEQALLLYQEFGIEVFISRTRVSLTEMMILCGDQAGAQALVARWELTASPYEHSRQALLMCRGLLAHHAGNWEEASMSFQALTNSEFSVRAALLGAQAAIQAGHFDRREAALASERLLDLQPHQLMPVDAQAVTQVNFACASLSLPQPLSSQFLNDWTAATQLSTAPQRPAPFTLQIRTLGKVQVRLNDRPVHIPLSRSVEMLAWLAIHREGSRDQIMNDLWDGSSEQRHLEYFKVAVRHLRLALSSDPNVTFNPLQYQQGRYFLAPEFTLEVDALLPSQLLITPTSEGLQKIIDAYQGPFLPGSESSWVETRRTALLDQALSAGLMLAQRPKRQDLARATNVLEWCVNTDPLHEEAHLQLIKNWEARGEKEAARHCYHRYRRMLAEEWQRLPASELRERYEPP